MPLYKKVNLKKDTSKRNLLTRWQKREMLIAFIYSFAESVDNEEEVKLVLGNKNRLLGKEIIKRLSKNNWVRAKPDNSGYIILTPGSVKTPLKHIIRKMSFGEKHEKRLKRVLQYMQTPYLPIFLAHHCGDIEKGMMRYDFREYLKQDLPLLKAWFKDILDIEASVENDDHLSIDMNDYQKLEESFWRGKK